MDWDLIRPRILREPLDQLSSEIPSTPLPYAFVDRPSDFEALKRHIRERLHIGDSDEIVVIGSGLIGFSLGPDNFGSPFAATSDIDAAIVSATLFDDVWNSLLSWRSPWHVRTWPKDTERWARTLLQCIVDSRRPKRYLSASFEIPYQQKARHLR